MDKNYYLLVYGSLRVGEYNWEKLKDEMEFVRTEFIKGYSMYDLGDYPAIVKDKNATTPITMDLFRVDKTTFDRIYTMELDAGYSIDGIHILENGRNIQIYFFSMANITLAKQGKHTLIESGDWVERNKTVKRSIYVVGGGNSYVSWMEGKVADKMEDADLVVFTGGEDVDPTLYGEDEHYTTGANIDRDLVEKAEFEKAVSLKKQIVAICRGSQLICVLNGGKLIQHMNHPYTHFIITDKGEELEATSTHHQMQFPYNLKSEDYGIIAWARNKSPYHLGGENEEMNPDKDCEIVYYPKTKALAIQMHPEHFHNKHKTIEYLRNLLDNIYGEDKEKVSEFVEESVQSK